MRKNVTQITYDRRAPFHISRIKRYSDWKKETRYDLDFGRRGRPVLHNSQHATCDVVDIHSGVRPALREPRADQGTIALDNKGLLGGNVETKAFSNLPRRPHRSRRCDGRVIPNAQLSFVSSSTNRSSRLDWAGHALKSRFC